MLEQALLMERAFGWTEQREEPAETDAPWQTCSACSFPKFFLTAQEMFVLWEGSERLGRKKTKVLIDLGDFLEKVLHSF